MLTKDNAVLMVIDVQGKLAQLMHETEEMIQQQGVLIDGCKLLGTPILWLEQVPDKLGPTAPILAEKLAPLQPIAKSSFSACGSETLMQTLNALRKREVILCGIETHICVYQTARDLRLHGYGVTVVEDAVSSRTANNKRIGLNMMQQLGVRTACVESVLFEIQTVAEGDAFKQLTRLVK